MKKLLVLLLVVAIGGTSSAAVAQRPAKAVIRGVVLTKGSDAPIADAWVILTKLSDKPPESVYAGYYFVPVTPSAVSDRDGRFEIHDLDPESYKLTVLRNGYTRQVYGQRVENGLVPPIDLNAGDSKDLSIHLAPTGSVSGVVRDTSGQPIAGAEVSLVRRPYTSLGARTFRTVASTRTNDRGEYRFYWITPGRYYLQAGGNPGRLPSINEYDREIRHGNNEVRGEYATTYFPGASDVEKALAIDVHPRSELRDMNLTLEKPKRFRLRVHAIDAATGQPPQGLMLDIETATGHAYGEWADDPYEDEFRPGLYWIGYRADVFPITDRKPASTATPVASAKVVVADADVELVLSLVLPAIIKGQVFVDGELPPSAKLDEVSFKTQPGDGVPTGELGENIFFSTAKADAAGTFILNGIPDYEFRVLPLSLPAGTYLKAARLDGIDVLNARASFAKASRLELVISSSSGRIEGMVTDDRSNPMPNVQAVLVPASRRDRTDLFKSVNTDSAGRFNMTAITPGDYRLFAWEAIEPYAWFDPEVLASSESQGKPVHVSESSVQTVELRMIPEDGTR